MSFREHHHQHHHQRPPCVEEDYGRTEVFEGERLYAPPPPSAYPSSYDRVNSGHYERPHNIGSNYQRNERLGELGAVAAAASALYEGKKSKTDPCHASKHKIEEEAGALGALGSTGYAYYEHSQKDKCKDGRW